MTATLHRLMVTLNHVEPRVQREIVVPSDLRLDRLHSVLQVAMGWENAHMHEFLVGGRRNGARIGVPQPEFAGFGTPVLSQKRYTLTQIAPAKGAKFEYWYDFGDDWHHTIRTTAILNADSVPESGRPVCLKARGACPPEDCGRPPGYANLLDILGDPTHPEYEGMKEWVGGDFNPAFVDVDAINGSLAKLSRRWAAKPATRRRKAALG